MDVRNCKKCGKVFNYVAGAAICPACREAEENVFQEVKKFVQDHKEAEMNEIVEKCNVTHSQIKNWVRQERLVFAENSPIGIDCEGCGMMIKTGRFCEKCKYDLYHGLSNSISQKKAEPPAMKKSSSERAKMRFLDN